MVLIPECGVCGDGAHPGTRGLRAWCSARNGDLSFLAPAGDSRRSRSPLAGEGGTRRRRRGREREAVSPLPPAGCGGRCFAAPPPLCVPRVCGPSLHHPGSAASSRTRGVTLRRAEEEGESRGRGCKRSHLHLMLSLPPHLHLPSRVRGTLPVSPALRGAWPQPHPGEPGRLRVGVGSRVQPVCSAGLWEPRLLSRTAAKSARKKWLKDGNS